MIALAVKIVVIAIIAAGAIYGTLCVTAVDHDGDHNANAKKLRRKVKVMHKD